MASMTDEPGRDYNLEEFRKVMFEMFTPLCFSTQEDLWLYVKGIKYV